MNKKRNVLFLGLVSLFTDLSSQMIYPFIPEFLSGLGAGKGVIGLIEGIAESVASIFKTVSGKLSDKYKKRKLFIALGYGLSTVSKPFLYFADSWFSVLLVKISDRVGKAARTPARDSLISTSVSPQEKGRAFGFHRAMDRTGAIGGPLLALLVLSTFNNNIRMVFLLSFIPAALALFFIYFVKEEPAGSPVAVGGAGEKVLKDKTFVMFLTANVVFTLGNSSNAFLLLKARETGLKVGFIPLIWIVYNIFCTGSSPVFGRLSDRLGRKPVIITSFLYYSVLYFLFGIAKSLAAIWLLFAAYGLYYGLSEGVYRAYIADIVEPEKRATAYGIFNTGVGLALLPASLMMGLIWDNFGSSYAFFTSAFFSFLGFLIYLLSMTFKKPQSMEERDV